MGSETRPNTSWSRFYVDSYVRLSSNDDSNTRWSARVISALLVKRYKWQKSLLHRWRTRLDIAIWRIWGKYIQFLINPSLFVDFSVCKLSVTLLAYSSTSFINLNYRYYYLIFIVWVSFYKSAWIIRSDLIFLL